MLDKNKIKILLVDDEVISLQNVGHYLENQGFQITTTETGTEALELLNKQHFDLVITDLKIGDIDGVQILKTAKELYPEIEVIIVTGYATIHSAVEAMAQGAFYYLPKPITLKELHDLVLKAVEKTMLRREINRLKKQIKAQHGTKFIGQNSAILRLKESIVQFSQLDCNIIISGETGTGKELVARLIYEMSPRSDKRFLPINCGAMNEELMLNELFGHEKFAFTNAGSLHKGLLETTNGGVVLFDEIGEMSISMQVKLLRALQEKKILRLGGTQEIPIDIRILAATNRDLAKEVEKGRFRQDLFYRLNVVNLHIPPLKDRMDDIPLLANYFIAKYSLPKDNTKSLSPEALQRLQEYDYPGNTRELENIIERSMALCRGQEIKIRHLPENFGMGMPFTLQNIKQDFLPNKSLEENEQDYILSVLKNVNGNKTQAAKIIGIDRVSLWRKLKKYKKNGIDIN